MDDILSALSNLKENLQCGYCNKLPLEGTRFLKCSHLFCTSHISSGQLKCCFICHEGNLEDVIKTSVESEMINDCAELEKIFMKSNTDHHIIPKDSHTGAGTEPARSALPAKVKSVNSPPLHNCKSPEKNKPLVLDADKQPGRVLRRKLRKDQQVVTYVENVSPVLYNEAKTKSPKVNRGTRSSRTASKSPLGITVIEDHSFPSKPKTSVKPIQVSSKDSVQSCDDSFSDPAKINKKTIWKRNNKGETTLHSACVKGKEELVRGLLAAGADPNTRDHAGWTPLHEAVSAGRGALAALLLRHGALPAPPGPLYTTPLHEAARAGLPHIALALLRAGADPAARDYKGQTPADLADESLKLRLSEALDKVPVTEPKIRRSLFISIFPSGLSKTHSSKLNALCRSHKEVTLVKSLSGEGTFLLVEQCRVDCDTLLAVAGGHEILTTAWLDSCNTGALANCEQFLLNSLGGDTECVRLSTSNRVSLKPGLFDGYNFYFLGFKDNYEISAHLTVKKAYLGALVEAAGGTVLSREPKPENIREKHFPYHAPRSGLLENCTHVIVYETCPQLAYNMPHVKSLPVGWLVDCLLNFRLVNPNP